MTETKKPRIMTAKGFLHKTTTKAASSAGGFIAQYRDWLETGELAAVTSPILLKVDQGVLFPTPALEMIKEVVMMHHMASEIRKGEEAMARKAEGPTPKNWTATIYNAKGEVQTKINSNGETEELVKGFEKGHDADRWVDRRLFEGATDWFGVVAHSTMTTSAGDPIATTIMRDDSIARILKTPKGPVCQPPTKTTSKLGFGCKAKGDHSRFSHG